MFEGLVMLPYHSSLYLCVPLLGTGLVVYTRAQCRLGTALRPLCHLPLSVYFEALENCLIKKKIAVGTDVEKYMNDEQSLVAYA